MTVHYYAFGSICRGEVDIGSDIDLLACVSDEHLTIDATKFSIYTHQRIMELWRQGNPFAWHLYYESRLLYSSDGTDFLKLLNQPMPYSRAMIDCNKFLRLFKESYSAIIQRRNSVTFHLSCMFLAMRNFATCYSFLQGRPIFSRKSPVLLARAVNIAVEDFEVFSRARILSTRGYGDVLTDEEIHRAVTCAPCVLVWMNRLMVEVRDE